MTLTEQLKEAKNSLFPHEKEPITLPRMIEELGKQLTMISQKLDRHHAQIITVMQGGGRLPAENKKKNRTGDLCLAAMEQGQNYSTHELYKAVLKHAPEIKQANVSGALSKLSRNNRVVMIRKGLYRLPD